MNLPEYIRGMLEYKESLGYSRKTYESYPKDFQRHFMGEAIMLLRRTLSFHGAKKGILRRQRITPLRELSKYLYAMGYAGYIVLTDIFPTIHRETPYIFTGGRTYQAVREKRQGAFLHDKPIPPSGHPCHLQADLLLRPAPKRGQGIKAF